MSATAAERLRTLVTDYYHGLLTFDSYREQRGKLFDTMQLDARRPPAEPPAAPTPAPAPEESDETQTHVALRPPPELVAPVAATPAPAPLPQPPRFGRNAVFAGGGAAIAAAVLIAYVALRPGVDDVPAAASGTDPAPAPAVALPPGAALLEQFAQRNVWTPEAIRTLEVTWDSALSDEERRAARESPSYGRFGETLRLRLRGEEALSVGQASAELESLVSLAKRLDMPYAESLELPTPRDTAVTPAPQAVEPPAVAGDLAAPDSAAVVVQSPPPVAADARSSQPAAAETGGAAAAAPPPAAPARESAVPAPVVAVSPESAATPDGGAPAAADAAPACSARLLDTRRPFCRDLLRDGREGPALAILPAGKFLMGGDGANEGPQHEVTIGASIAMSTYEISAADFNLYCTSAGAACPDNPWSAGDFPAVLVSFADATAYAAWLSGETGQRYRLPSEAEWEYAARAGTTTPYPFGDAVTPAAARSSVNGAVDSPLANSDRSVNRNAFRLFHMIGNVREWVLDEWHADHAGAPPDGSARAGAASAPHVVRGGAYADGARQLRSAARSPLPADTRDRLTGFRVVRELAD